jgi:pimeloyl-ACP methyl ester carboxylesterase
MSRRARSEIYWRENGHGPPLVLLNGWSASGIAWPSEWVHELRSQFRVIRIDNRGTGWSRYARTPFTMADLADDVLAVLEDAEIDRATVFGLSMGGMIAQEVAIRAPERVGGLVLAGTAPPMPAYRPKTSLAATALLRPIGRRETLEDYFRSLWSQAVGEGFADRHPEIVDELVGQVVQRPTPRRLLVHQLRAVLGWGHAGRLAGISAPTVILHGTDDRFIEIGAGRRIAELIPGSRFVELDGVGHLIPHEDPWATFAAIGDITERRVATGDVATPRDGLLTRS